MVRSGLFRRCQIHNSSFAEEIVYRGWAECFVCVYERKEGQFCLRSVFCSNSFRLILSDGIYRVPLQFKLSLPNYICHLSWGCCSGTYSVRINLSYRPWHFIFGRILFQCCLFKGNGKSRLSQAGGAAEYSIAPSISPYYI